MSSPSISAAAAEPQIWFPVSYGKKSFSSFLEARAPWEQKKYFTTVAQHPHHQVKKYNITDLNEFAAIHQSPNGKLGARYEQFVPILIKAIQELSSKVDKLENEGKE